MQFTQSLINSASLKVNLPFKSLRELLYDSAATFEHHGIFFINNEYEMCFLSYKDLLKEAKQILSGFHDKGIHAGSYIILQVEDNREFIITLWAAILGGIIPVPLMAVRHYNHENNDCKRLIHLIVTLEDVTIITNESSSIILKTFLEKNPSPIVPIYSFTQLYSCDGTTIMDNNISGDTVAIMFPTSGSTGAPKIVQQTHTALLKSIAGIIEFNHFNSQDKLLNWMPLDHIGGISMCHFLGIALNIDQIHINTNAILQQPLKLIEIMSQSKATFSWIPNFAYAIICDALTKNTDTNLLIDLSYMRFIVNGGEMIASKTARTFLKAFARYGLASNAIKPTWGMSETCSAAIFSHEFSLETTSDEDKRTILGKPISGLSIQIVDENGDIVPEQTQGSLEVKGDIVTIGYYGNHTLNESAFTKNGWYRTGDLGYIESGNLVITGRDKDVIIINGINIDAIEIETLVESLIDILPSYTAAISVKDMETMNEKLAIIFVPKESARENLTQVVKQIRALIVKKMNINTEFIIPLKVEDIPKTSIGKIQRSILKKYVENNLYHISFIHGEQLQINENNNLLLTPENEHLFLAVKKVWADVFQIPLKKIDAQSNFFELGGDSIKVVQIVYGCSKENIIIEGHSIYEYPILLDLVIYLHSLLTEEKENHVSHLYNQALQLKDSGNVDRSHIPLTNLQQAYLFGEKQRLSLDNTVANVYLETEISDLNVDKFTASFNLLIARHPMLRGIIQNDCWSILSNVPYYIPEVYNSQDSTQSEIKQQIEKSRIKIQTATLDSSCWPLFVVQIYQVSSNHYRIMFIFCLLGMDGMSISTLINELDMIYHEKKHLLWEVSLHPADYVNKIKNLEHTSMYIEAKKYWNTKLKSFSNIPKLPLVNYPSDKQNNIFNNAHIIFPKDKWCKLKKTIARHNVTASMFIYGIFSRLIGFFSQDQDFCINVLFFNRHSFHTDVNHILGNFSDTMIFDTHIYAGESFEDF